MYECKLCKKILQLIDWLQHNCENKQTLNYKQNVNKIVHIKHENVNKIVPIKHENVVKSESFNYTKKHSLIRWKVCLLKIYAYRFDKHQYSCKKILDNLEINDHKL